MCIEVGSVVKTSYGAGPFRIIKVHGPCSCPKYTTPSFNFKNPLASRPHYHFVCTDNNGNINTRLNGYIVANGKIKSVCCNAEIQIISFKPGYQLSLFN